MPFLFHGRRERSSAISTTSYSRVPRPETGASRHGVDPRTPLYMARAGGVSDLPDADRRVIAVAANSLFERAFGRPKIGAEEKDDLVARLEAMPPEERVRTARQLLEEGRRYCRIPRVGAQAKPGRLRQSQADRGGPAEVGVTPSTALPDDLRMMFEFCSCRAGRHSARPNVGISW